MNTGFKKVIAIGAHFDDIEINCGGTLSKFIAEGSDVLAVVVGDGDYGHHDGAQLRSGVAARTEGEEAMQILGIPADKLISLSYPEKRITYDEKLIGAIEKVIEDFSPDLIITHWLHDSHQDHVAVSNAVISAARNYYSIWMWEPVFPSGRITTVPYAPQLYVDISAQHQQKTQSIRTHQSQVVKFYGRGVKWLEGIEARAHFRGYECGSESAETFYVFRHKLK